MQHQFMGHHLVSSSNKIPSCHTSVNKHTMLKLKLRSKTPKANWRWEAQILPHYSCSDPKCDVHYSTPATGAEPIQAQCLFAYERVFTQNIPSRWWFWRWYQGIFSPLFSHQQRIAIQTSEGGGSAFWAVTELICSFLFTLASPSFFLFPPEAASMDGRLTDWESSFLRSIPVGEINTNLNCSQKNGLYLHTFIGQSALLTIIIKLSGSCWIELFI